MFEIWAHEHQRAPKGDWSTWVILGGRGAGKTRAGAEWVRAQLEGSTPNETGKYKSVALIGETFEQTRDIMVFGESGILQCSPPDRRPTWSPSLKQLTWPNGAIARLYSASDPESLRGPQFELAWVDELAKWKKAPDTWDMLQFCLRMGTDPRVVVTTTPRQSTLLKSILKASDTVMTTAPTAANKAYLADKFLLKMQNDYAGTRLGQQELEGILLNDLEGAFWTSAQLNALYTDNTPKLDRVIVAVDPPAKSGHASDECGIVVVGIVAEGSPHQWCSYVLADCSIKNATPAKWGRQVVEVAKKYNADRIVAEVNQGGEMVEAVIRQFDPLASFKAVHASKGKMARAEPIAALYEQGKVQHVKGLTDLESQMCEMTLQGYEGRGSPDRLDALVWALHELMIVSAKAYQSPQIRRL